MVGLLSPSAGQSIWLANFRAAWLCQDASGGLEVWRVPYLENRTNLFQKAESLFPTFHGVSLIFSAFGMFRNFSYHSFGYTHHRCCLIIVMWWNNINLFLNNRT